MATLSITGSNTRYDGNGSSLVSETVGVVLHSKKSSSRLSLDDDEVDAMVGTCKNPCPKFVFTRRLLGTEFLSRFSDQFPGMLTTVAIMYVGLFNISGINTIKRDGLKLTIKLGVSLRSPTDMK